MANCRGCGARIFWAQTNTGKNIPVEYDPDLEAEFLNAAQFKTTVDFDFSRMRAHFVLCPKAKEFRGNGQKDFHKVED